MQNVFLKLNVFFLAYPLRVTIQMDEGLRTWDLK